MKFERLADDASWSAWPSFSGPAGTVTLDVDPALVEFDVIDHGRIVRLVVFDDADDEAGERVFGAAWNRLRQATDGGLDVLHIDETTTPVWAARRDLATAATLIQDRFELESERRWGSAGLAAAELAEVLHRVATLAPEPAEQALAIAGDHLRRASLEGRPNVAEAAVPGVRGLADLLALWAPAELADVVHALGRPTPRPMVVAAPQRARVTFGAGTAPLPATGGVAWQGSTGSFPLRAEGTGTVQMHNHGVAQLQVPATGLGERPWGHLFAEERLIAAGPLTVAGDLATAWFGPLDGLPTDVVVTASPFADDLPPAEHVREALGEARTALDTEPVDAQSAAWAWRRCATEWLGIDETGRAAIALDRAATAHQTAGFAEPARSARELAAAYAPAWARPYLAGRSGSPLRPLWRQAISPTSQKECR